MKKINLLLLMMISVLSISSCGKDEDGNAVQPEKSNMEKIVNKKWKIVSDLADGVDQVPGRDACTNDDITTFSADGKFVVDEGATKCDPNDPQIFVDGTFATKDNILTTTINGNSVSSTILELNDKTLKFSTNTGGVTLVSTFAAQ